MSGPTDNGYGTLFPADWGEPAHEAIYYDADGTEVFRKLRWSRVEEGKRKTIRQCHWDGGKWVAKLPNRKLPLYRLPDLLANPEKPILFVEGEPACDTAAVPVFSEAQLGD